MSLAGVSTAVRVDNAVTMFRVGEVFTTDQIRNLVMVDVTTRTVAGYLRRNIRVVHIKENRTVRRGNGLWERLV